MNESTRRDLGTWDTAVGLVLGLVLLAAQFPLGFTSVATLLISLGALTVIFAAFLLRAAWGRQLSLVFLNAPVAVWSVFWFVVSRSETANLSPFAVVAGATLLVLFLAKLYPQWCHR